LALSQDALTYTGCQNIHTWTTNIVDRSAGTAMRNYRGRVGKFGIAGSISYLPRPCFGNVSVYGSLSRMQSATWGNVVDEEQDIRNDGSKSSRFHRAFKFSVISNGTFFDGWLAYGENLPRIRWKFPRFLLKAL
jgi:hypothetical protein